MAKPKQTKKRATVSKRRKAERQRRTMMCIIAALAVLLIIGLIVLWCAPEKEAPEIEVPERTIPENTYIDEAFYQSDGYLHYAAEEDMVGIDVSAHQGLIDWTRVRDSGIEYAVIRAGYRGSTEGRLYEDAQFRYNFESAQTVGLPVAVYFYSQAVTTQEAVEEAQFVCDLLDGYTPDLPVFYDWEHGDSSGRISGVSGMPITDFAVAFCEEIKAAGYDAGVYFNLDYAYHHLDLLRLQDYTLWLAEYNLPPTFPYRFDWLQYSDGGIVPGIEGTVDMDLMLIPGEASEDFVITYDTNKTPAE